MPYSHSVFSQASNDLSKYDIYMKLKNINDELHREYKIINWNKNIEVIPKKLEKNRNDTINKYINYYSKIEQRFSKNILLFIINSKLLDLIMNSSTEWTEQTWKEATQKIFMEVHSLSTSLTNYMNSTRCLIDGKKLEDSIAKKINSLTAGNLLKFNLQFDKFHNYSTRLESCRKDIKLLIKKYSKNHVDDKENKAQYFLRGLYHQKNKPEEAQCDELTAITLTLIFKSGLINDLDNIIKISIHRRDQGIAGHTFLILNHHGNKDETVTSLCSLSEEAIIFDPWNDLLVSAKDFPSLDNEYPIYEIPGKWENLTFNKHDQAIYQSALTFLDNESESTIAGVKGSPVSQLWNSGLLFNFNQFHSRKTADVDNNPGLGECLSNGVSMKLPQP